MPEDSSGAFEGLLRAGPERTLPARGYGPACLVGDGPAGPAAARCAVNGRYWPSVSRLRRISRLTVDGLRPRSAATARMEWPACRRSPMRTRSSSDRNRAEMDSGFRRDRCVTAGPSAAVHHRSPVAPAHAGNAVNAHFPAGLDIAHSCATKRG